MEKSQSELTVIMKAKDLCAYIMTVTQKSPKEFRFTFTSRMQNTALDVIEHLYRANDVYVLVGDKEARMQIRLDYQHQALTELRLLAYIAEMALKEKAILPKHYEQIAKQSADCMNLIGAWIQSDKRRFA